MRKCRRFSFALANSAAKLSRGKTISHLLLQIYRAVRSTAFSSGAVFPPYHCLAKLRVAQKKIRRGFARRRFFISH